MKNNLPYFSHDNNARRHPKMKALIAEFGYEGYGRFWALNERIAESSGACIDISKKVNKLDLAQELGLNNDGLDTFLDFLSDPEIDLINLNDNKISTDRIVELFSKTMENREDERDRKRGKNGKDDFPDGNGEIPPGKDDFPPGKTYRQDKTRLDKTKQDINPSGSAARGEEQPPPEGESKKPESPVPKPKKPPLRDREPENDLERVEKAYLQNWDTLYSEGRVTTLEPVVNWNQTRALLKRHFVKLKPDQIIRALHNGMTDSFVMSGGYSLGVMLAASVLNRLINAGQGPGPPPALKDKKSLGGLDQW